MDGRRYLAVDIRKTVEVRDNLALVGVEDYQLISVHVGDVEPPLRGDEALIVEANG